MWCFMSFKLLGSYTNYFQVVPLINFSRLIKRRWSIKSLSCWVRNNMETYSMKMTKFHKSGKWRNNRLIYNTFIKVNLCTWIPFCCFPSKTKLINLFSFLWNTLLNWNIKAMTLKKLGRFVNENCAFHKLLFLKKTGLCLPWAQRFEKLFARESKYEKPLNASADN